MFGIGFFELICLAAVALIVLGPEKLPQAARSAGMWYGKFRRTLATMQNDIEQELNLAEARKQMEEELEKIKQAEQDMKANMQRMENDLKAMQTQTAQQTKDFVSQEQQALNAVTTSTVGSTDDDMVDLDAVAKVTANQDLDNVLANPKDSADLSSEQENYSDKEYISIEDDAVIGSYTPDPLFVRMTVKQQTIHMPNAPFLPRLYK